MSSGAGNTGLGSNSLSSLSNASYNTSVGYDSLNNINNNSRNTAIGAYAGSSNSTGSNNVYIGYYAGYYDTNSNVFYLDNQDRYSWSLAQSSALLFGQFSGTPSSQTLVTNSAFTATYGINIPYGQTYKINGVPISTGTSYITSLTTTGSSGSSTVVSGVLNVPTYTLIGLGGQPQLNGTGFIKASGTTISYDNSTYLTTTSAASTYQPLITLTTTGSNGSSSFISNTLNIPTYTLSGLGGQPLSTNLTSLGGLLYPSSLSFVKMSSSGTFTLDTNTYLTTSSASSTYQPIISLTTTGTSGPATLIGNVLNIPQYSGGGGGMVYPGTTGIVYYNGSGWGTSYSTSGSGTTLALVNSPTFVGTSTFNAISATTINGLTFTGTLGGTLNVGSGVNLSNLATLSYSSLSFVKMSASGTFSLDTNSYQLSSTAYNTSNANLNSVNWTTNALSVSGAAVLNSSLTINQSANAKFILYDQTSGDGYWNIYSSGTALYFRSSNYATVLYLNGSSNTISGNLNNIGGIFQINGNNLSKALITGGADPIPVATTSSTGLLPILAGGTSSWLRSDGTWQAIPIFTNFTQGVVPPPSFATNDHFLSTDGTWLVPIPANTNLGTSGSVARISGNLHTYIGDILSSGTTTLFTYTLPGNSIVNQGDIIDIYAIFSASSSNISAISLIMNTSLSSYECDSPSITANGMVKIHYQICWLDPVYGYSIVACEELIYGTSYYTYTSGVITGDWLTTSSQTYSLRVSFTSGSLSFLYGYLTLSPAT
jgi:hypothetical protein